MSTRTYVHPSTKRFFDFSDIWHIGRGRLVMHDDMQYDPIKGQGHEPHCHTFVQTKTTNT